MEIMHIGVPVREPKEGEGYAEGLKVHIAGPETNAMQFEYLRFEADTPMHEEIVNNVHVAYKVEALADYLDKYEVLHAPMAVDEELTIAFIKMDGVVVELMEFK
jgi:hypothetical protein